MMRPTSHHLRSAVAILVLVAVNAGGFALARAQDADADLRSLDPRAVERPADALAFNRQHVESLFRSDVEDVLRAGTILTPQGRDVDTARVAEVLSGELGDVDLLQASPGELLGKVSELREQMEIQGEISRRVSISSFESAVMDAQTQKLTDAFQALSRERDGVTRGWLDSLKASDTASSYMNNLPPL